MSERSTGGSSWPLSAGKVGEERLVLDARQGDAMDRRANLSAAVLVGDTLFLGSDEGVVVESLRKSGKTWREHDPVDLAAILGLDPEAEADIEGLDEEDGWLWVLGSHARTRPKLAKHGADRIDLLEYANLKDTRARCLLGRVPIQRDPDRTARARLAREDGTRRAGILKQTKRGNRLAKMIADQPLLRPFTFIGAKEGGVDLEGLAVSGTRIAIGMRGPVIQTYAVLLEFEIAAKRSGALKIAGPLYPRLLELGGLGIRDLMRVGSDLLILAGPATGLDGPSVLYRWTDWVKDPPRDETVVRLHRPEHVLDLPFGRGDDHPEGLFILPGTKGGEDIVVICDSPAAHRVDRRTGTIRCDRFRLPDKTT